jgi:hypothetical protein
MHPKNIINEIHQTVTGPATSSSLFIGNFYLDEEVVKLSFGKL